MGYTAAERDALRGGIEREYAELRDAEEKNRINFHNQIDVDSRSYLADIAKQRREALVAAGLNPNGSDPRTASQPQSS